MNKFIPFLISGILLIGTFGCGEKTAKTDSENSSPTNEVSVTETGEAEDSNQPELENVPDSSNAESNEENPQESDLSRKVSDKLAENLPDNNLEIQEQEGIVTIDGTVASQEELQQIEPLAKGVEGVKSVKVEASVENNTPAEDSTPE